MYSCTSTQIGETCSSNSECDTGLRCDKCDASGNTRSRCVRVQPLNPTSKVGLFFFVFVYLFSWVVVFWLKNICRAHGMLWFWCVIRWKACHITSTHGWRPTTRTLCWVQSPRLVFLYSLLPTRKTRSPANSMWVSPKYAYIYLTLKDQY